MTTGYSLLWTIGYVVALLAGIALAVIVAVRFDIAEGRLLVFCFVAPVVVVMGLQALFGKPKRPLVAAEVTGEPDSGYRYFAALGAGLVFVVGLTYIGYAWLVAPIGLCGLIYGFRERAKVSGRSAIAFVSIFVAIYGILAAIIQWNLR